MLLKGNHLFFLLVDIIVIFVIDKSDCDGIIWDKLVHAFRVGLRYSSNSFPILLMAFLVLKL